MTRETVALGVIALVISLIVGGVAADEDAQREAEATAASVQDAQRTARLQAAIDRECSGSAEAMQCALRVVQRERPQAWTAEQTRRAEASARIATQFDPSESKP